MRFLNVRNLCFICYQICALKAASSSLSIRNSKTFSYEVRKDSDTAKNFSRRAYGALQKPASKAPQTPAVALSKSFCSSFPSPAREKNGQSDTKRGKRKLAFVFLFLYLTDGESKDSPSQNDASPAVPLRKVFAELFPKSDTRRRSALRFKSNQSPQ